MANNVYTVNGRLSQLENAVTELKKENSDLRVHLWSALETKANDLKHVIQDSIRIPLDGKDGHDGADGQSIVGPKGERGDVLHVGPAEMQQAVIDARRKLKEQHAAHIAVLVEHIEGQKKGTWVGQHYAKLLESIKQEIEKLQAQ